MTVAQAIAALKRIEAKHGPDAKLYFDCPACRQSFTPGLVETKAVHMTSETTHD